MICLYSSMAPCSSARSFASISSVLAPMVIASGRVVGFPPRRTTLSAIASACLISVMAVFLVGPGIQ